MHWRLVSKLFVLAAALASCASELLAQHVVHAVTGAVSKVDAGAKTIAVKTADGSEEVFKYTAKTSVHGATAAGDAGETAAVDTYIAGKEGTHVVVRYVGKGADKTAIGIKDFGKDSLKVSKGTVTHVDRTAHTVGIKSEDGAEATYRLGKNAAVDTEHGVVDGTKYTAKEGDHVVVHYSEEAGHKVVHFLKNI
jgi:hypothetical protein